MPDLTVCQDADAWDDFVSQAVDSSPLQAWAWGTLKAQYGWGVRRYLWQHDGRPRSAMQVLSRKLPGGLALHYAPRGPVLNGHMDEWPAFWQALRPRLRSEGGTVLKFDPEWTTPQGQAILQRTGGRLSPHPIQHQATFVVDISGGDEALKRMKGATRREIRYGERRGITVQSSVAPSAIDAFFELLEESAAYHRFVIRPRSYYQDVFRAFRERDQTAVYLACHGGVPIAGAVMLFYGRKLIYLFGGTSRKGRELSPSYILQWRAIQDAQRRGCTRYDMWGVPLNPTPEHPGHGYYFFKSRFNGEPLRYIGLYDLPVRQPLAMGIRFGERILSAGGSKFI